MTQSSLGTETRRLSGTTVFTVGMLALLASSEVWAAPRQDVIVNFANPGLTSMVMNDFAFNVDVVGGSASLQTDNIDCVARPEHPCSYSLGQFSVSFAPLLFSGYHITNMVASIQTPITVSDFGMGIVIPAGTPGTLTYLRDGSAAGHAGNMSAAGELRLFPGTQSIVFMGSFVGSEEGVSVKAEILSVGARPFVNLPPKAEAGPDQTLCPNQLAHFDGSGSTDANGDIATYQWYENGSLIASGVTADVSLGVGTHTVTLVVLDSHGGQGTDSVVVNVIRDTVPPVFTAYPPSVVQISSCTDPDVGYAQAKAQDNCPGEVDISYDTHSFEVGTTTVTWTAKDVAGNTTTWQQTVKTGPPAFVSLPPSGVTTTGCDNQRQKPDIGTATARDVCGGVLTMSNGGVANNAPATFPFGDTTVTWKATDASGSLVSFAQAVSVVAVDLGAEHQISSVVNNACLRVTQYPSSWGPYMHAIRIQAQAAGVGFPIPFTWTNSCPDLKIDNAGSGSLPAPWQEGQSRPLDTRCPTLIKLDGNGAGSVDLTWWGNG
jgi:hypothetical protein